MRDGPTGGQSRPWLGLPRNHSLLRFKPPARLAGRLWCPHRAFFRPWSRENFALLSESRAEPSTDSGHPRPCATGGVLGAVALRDDFFEQDRPPHQGIAAFSDTRLDGKAQVVCFAGQARHLGGCLGDVQDQHAPAARDIVVIGHEGLLLVSHGAGPLVSGAAPLNADRNTRAALWATAGPQTTVKSRVAVSRRMWWRDSRFSLLSSRIRTSAQRAACNRELRDRGVRVSPPPPPGAGR